MRERDRLIAQRSQDADRCDAMSLHHAWLRRRIFGLRADRLRTPPDVAQMYFEFAHGLSAMPIDPERIPPEDRDGATDPSDERRVRGRRGRSGRS